MKFVLRIIATVLSIAISVYGVFFAVNRIGQEGVSTEPEEYSCILKMWQIDTFPGGMGSRLQFLLRVASRFEKQNAGLLISVTNETPSGAEQKMANREFPDIVSYGVGIDVTNLQYLKTTSEFLGGKISDKTVAVPWARGGYFLFINENKYNGTLPAVFDKITVSDSEYTSPFTALICSEYKAKEVVVKESLSAYYDFVTGKTGALLGTQRDINRLSSREISYSVLPLSGYSDIFQYVSVTTDVADRIVLAEKFISYLISDATQSRINEIGMFSPYRYQLYDNTMATLESAFPVNTISALTGKSGYKELKELSQNVYLGNNEEQFKIKNKLINLDNFYFI